MLRTLNVVHLMDLHTTPRHLHSQESLLHARFLLCSPDPHDPAKNRYLTWEENGALGIIWVAGQNVAQAFVELYGKGAYIKLVPASLQTAYELASLPPRSTPYVHFFQDVSEVPSQTFCRPDAAP